MGIKLYVGNLSFGVTQDQLQSFFEDFGAVQSVKIITDRDTGRSKGFAFVEFENSDEGQKAIEDSNGVEFNGRKLNVSEAKPQESKPRTGGFDRNRGPRRF